MTDRILEHARRTPARNALIHNGVACSYAEFARWITDCRERFEREAIPRRGVAVLGIGRLPDAWAALLALRSLGCTTIAVGDTMDVRGLDLRDVACAVTVEPEGSPGLESLAAEAGWPCVRLTRRTGPNGASRADSQIPAWAALPGKGHILLTSGTTGAYKKVLQEAGAEGRDASFRANLYGISGSSVAYVGNFPLWTALGYRWPLATWLEGGTVVFKDRRDMHHPFRHLRMTHAVATPATLAYLLDAPHDAFVRDDGLRLVVTAGALPHSLAAQASARLTRRVVVAYASTEASVVTLTPFETADDLYWHRILDSGEAQVVDESGRVLPAGAVGLVRVRALEGITGYLDDEAASREFFRDGYFYPGDLGQFREDGRLSLHGRVTDVINVMGNKIATGPIEHALQARLGADGICVFSLQGEGAQEEVHVAIQSRRAIDRIELAELARGELRAIARVHFHVVHDLPRNVMGKIRRDVLRNQVQASGRATR